VHHGNYQEDMTSEVSYTGFLSRNQYNSSARKRPLENNAAGRFQKALMSPTAYNTMNARQFQEAFRTMKQMNMNV